MKPLKSLRTTESDNPGWLRRLVRPHGRIIHKASCSLDAIKHRLQPRRDELLRCFQLGFLSIQKTSSVFVRQLHIFCVAAYLPCGVESSLASSFQDNAKPICIVLNSGNMMLPAIPRIGNSLPNATTIGDGALEKRNKNNPLGRDVALVFENPALAKVKPIASHSTNDSTYDSTYANYNGFFSWRHCFIWLLSFNIGLFGGILSRRMRSNVESLAT